MLLSGAPPFKGANKDETLKLIQKGEVNFSGLEWSKISDSAKNLIKRMLTVKPSDRINPQDAMNHEWIIKYAIKRENVASTGAQLAKLKSFHVNSLLMKTVLSFIASQRVEKEQVEATKRLFASLDANGDGQISKDELIEGYIKNGMASNTAIIEVNEIFDYVDLNQNGKIDYNGKKIAIEFIINFYYV